MSNTNDSNENKKKGTGALTAMIVFKVLTLIPSIGGIILVIYMAATTWSSQMDRIERINAAKERAYASQTEAADVSSTVADLQSQLDEILGR